MTCLDLILIGTVGLRPIAAANLAVTAAKNEKDDEFACTKG
jgi:hypothetical protein